ncbi:energy-coupling factor transporter transmembrane component T family protein [Microbacterium elymi]|uniref:Energy-coupling factor transporter transmembrane protein EcfT n=1 Tax=Microbacterium elymi TaxID=2909587 RepID=A0ABY5NN94_9MICO|nr:energy-coupling factor transporter transmembrane component T [Microbacterium elymi]UUT36643.1 energy-coupling factor transporter transmembrane protein EcfT [Microbacterium elymi]
MSILVADPRARVSSFNPVAKLVATLLITVTLLLSIDPVSAGVTLVLVLALMPWSGLSARMLWLRTWPLLIAAVLGAAATVLYGRVAGQTYLQWGLVHVSDGSLELAAAILLRVLAISLPAVVLLSTTDPTDLADGLSQLLRLPARFVLGALAGLRLVGLLIEDWRELSLARRARGVADTGRVRRLSGQAFALFVLAIRRGTKLATAMEARGFGAPGARTWARRSVLRPRDAVLVLIAAGVAAASVLAALAAGTWTFVWSL